MLGNRFREMHPDQPLYPLGVACRAAQTIGREPLAEHFGNCPSLKHRFPVDLQCGHTACGAFQQIRRIAQGFIKSIGLHVKLNAKLVQGSRILSQREVSEQMERIIASAEYSGDASNLYPGQWSSIQEDKPGDRVNRGSKSSLDGRFRSRFDPSVVPMMRDQVRSALAAKAARELRGAIADPSFMP